MHLPARSLRLLALLLVPSASLAQSTWFVDAAGVPPGSGTAADPYTSIGFALAEPTTLSGDTILVASGTYAESVDFAGKEVTVRHDGAGALPVIEGDGQASAVKFLSGEGPDARLIDIEVTGSVPAFPPIQAGGGILVNGANPLLERVTVRDSTAGFGGGVALLGGGLTLIDCQVLRCESENGGGGGIHVAAGSLTMRGGMVAECLADGGDHGGGIEALAGTSLVLEDLVIRDNDVNFGFGGGVCSDGEVLLTRVELISNGGSGLSFQCLGGGGIAAPLAIGEDCVLRWNGDFVAGRGGGAAGGTWTNTLFESNTSNGFGGGLHEGVAVRCRFVGNRVLGEGDVPSGPGGGADESSLTECLLVDNRAEGPGGGASDSDLIRCIVRSNESAYFDFSLGGGLFGGTAVDCLIEGNQAAESFDGAGGGTNGTDLLRCVVRGNSALVGGGVVGGTATRCTIVQNIALGGFGSFGGGTLGADVTNSILWGNLPDQTTGGMVSFSNVQDGFPGAGNIDAEPAFFGPGSDVHLLAGSPCIDAGDPNSPTDPDGSPADMGALPFEASHVREDSTFCVGYDAPDVVGQVGFSGPPARLESIGALLFVVSPIGNLTPRPFSGLPTPSALCLGGGIARVLPSAQSELELTPAQLGALGLGPGDRLLVQAFTGSRLSRGLDLLVHP